MIAIVTNRPEWVRHAVEQARAQTVGWPIRLVLHGIESDVEADEVIRIPADVPLTDVMNQVWPPSGGAKFDDHDIYHPTWIEQAGSNAVPLIRRIIDSQGREVRVRQPHVSLSGAVLPGWMWRMEHGLFRTPALRELQPRVVDLDLVVQRTPKGKER